MFIRVYKAIINRPSRAYFFDVRDKLTYLRKTKLIGAEADTPVAHPAIVEKKLSPFLDIIAAAAAL